MITPDTKDWTWVLEQACPECGYDAGSVDPSEIGDRTRAAIGRWQAVLRRDDFAFLGLIGSEPFRLN